MPEQTLRAVKGSNSPLQKGEGSTYFIPADDMPEGMKSGEQVKLIIEGLVTVDEQGASIRADKIYIENMKSRDDPNQSMIEKGLTIEMNIKK